MDTIEIERIARIEDDDWWYRERRTIVARELRRIGPPGRAVDIGSAGGGSTRLLTAHGWDAVAFDDSPDAVRLARDRGVDAHRGDARYLPLPSAHVDLAMALNVLEHVDDDRAAAAEIARVLRPGGSTLVCVPSDMALWSAGDVALGRVRRYSRPALADLLEGAGLLPDRIWSWNVLSRPVVRRVRHRTPRCADLVGVPPAAGRALHLLTLLERLLPVRSWPGVTLFARAHRPAVPTVRHSPAAPVLDGPVLDGPLLDGPALGTPPAPASRQVHGAPPTRRPGSGVSDRKNRLCGTP